MAGESLTLEEQWARKRRIEAGIETAKVLLAKPGDAPPPTIAMTREIAAVIAMVAADRDAYRKAYEGVCFTAFEAIGEVFYNETGMLRPGKDWGAFGPQPPRNLRHKFDNWAAQKGYQEKGCHAPDCEFCASEDEDGG